MHEYELFFDGQQPTTLLWSPTTYYMITVR